MIEESAVFELKLLF